MIEPLARLGYVSKAVVYGIVGTVAILAATRSDGWITDTSGALRAVLPQPYGRVLVLILAVGLCGYAAWRLLNAITDSDREGTSFRGWLIRGGNAVRGLVYGG